MENTKECKKCGSPNILSKNLPQVLLGLYLFVASIYGTYEIINKVIDFFR